MGAKTKPEDRIGTTLKTNSGVNCTCIAYRNVNDCDFEFENGTIVEHKHWGNFIRGQIAVPQYKTVLTGNKYIGQTKTTHGGDTATVIEYLGKCDGISGTHLLVQFDDGTTKRVGTQAWNKNQFTKNGISGKKIKENRERYIGKSLLQKNGLTCTLIEYVNSTNVTCQYPDGFTVKTRFQTFKNGGVPYKIHIKTILKKNQHEGSKSVNNLGYPMTLIAYHNSRHCTIRFDDGTIVNDIYYSHFVKGEVEHPKHRSMGKSSVNELSLLYYLKDFGFQKKKITEEPVKGLELDLYNKDLCIAIEYDGVFYHNKKKDIKKCNKCQKEGIRLMRIREEGLALRDTDDYSVGKGFLYHKDVDIAMNQLFDELRKIPELANLPIANTVEDKERISEFINENYHFSYVGKTAVMKNGQTATIIEATGGNNCTVKFEDGTIVSGKTFWCFRNGNVRNPNYTYSDYSRDLRKRELEEKWVGQTIDVQLANTTAKILSVEMLSLSKIFFVVRYENGIIEKISEYKMKNKKFCPEYYLEELRRIKKERCKEKQAIYIKNNKEKISRRVRLKYFREKGFDVSTEEGYARAIAAGKESAVNKRHERLREKYIGEKKKNNSGNIMEIIAVQDHKNVTVMFDNDPKKVRDGILLSEFRRGDVRSYDDTKNGRLYARRKARNGEWMEVIEYFGTNNMTVRFDSGEVVYHRTWANFIKGKVGKKSRQTKKELAA